MCRQIIEEDNSEKLPELIDSLREILADNQENLEARANFLAIRAARTPAQIKSE
jgi:hypothetical protein